MTLTQAVAFLNVCLKTDPKAINEIFHHSVPANKQLCDGPHVLVSTGGTLSPLSIINSMLCRGPERIEAVYDNETDEIVCFMLGRGYPPL